MRKRKVYDIVREAIEKKGYEVSRFNYYDHKEYKRHWHPFDLDFMYDKHGKPITNATLRVRLDESIPKMSKKIYNLEVAYFKKATFSEEKDKSYDRLGIAYCIKR